MLQVCISWATRWENLNNVWDLATSREPRCWWEDCSRCGETSNIFRQIATDLLAPKNAHPHHMENQAFRWQVLCNRSDDIETELNCRIVSVDKNHMVSTCFHIFLPFSTIFPAFSTSRTLGTTRMTLMQPHFGAAFGFEDRPLCDYGVSLVNYLYPSPMIAGPDIVPPPETWGHGKTWEDLWTQRGNRCLWLRYILLILVNKCKEKLWKNNRTTQHIPIIPSQFFPWHSKNAGSAIGSQIRYRWDATGAQQFALRCRRHSGIGSTSGHSADGGAGRRTGRRSVDVSYPNRRLFCLLKIYIFYLYGIWYTYGI